MLLEDQRFLHEDLERLEQGISDRVLEDPRHVRITLLIPSRKEPTDSDCRYVIDSAATTKFQGFSTGSSNSPNACLISITTPKAYGRKRFNQYLQAILLTSSTSS